MNDCWPPDRDYYFIEEAENILQLRTLKIRHLNRLRDVVEHVTFINYEELALDTGLLADIADRFGIRLEHRPPIDEARYFGGGKLRTFSAPRKYPGVSEPDLEFIRENLDWELEESIGYPWSDCSGRAAGRSSSSPRPSAIESVTPWKLHRP